MDRTIPGSITRSPLMKYGLFAANHVVLIDMCCGGTGVARVFDDAYEL
jgi:hypothetical protein